MDLTHLKRTADSIQPREHTVEPVNHSNLSLFFRMGQRARSTFILFHLQQQPSNRRAALVVYTVSRREGA
jgi:hypothetical protein